MRALILLPLLPLALAACRDEGTANAAPAADPRPELARRAAEAPLRARLRAPGELQQRGVQIFPQALADQYAVCGRTSLSGAAGDPFVPYVALVTFRGAEPTVASLSVGASGPEAQRVFLELVERCFEGGGPANARMSARALPPLPTAGPLPSTEAQAPQGPTLVSTQAAPAASGRSVMTSSRSGANVRSSPRGEVVRVAPRATELEVFGEAAGGWLEVGANGQAWGWVHQSVLEPR